MVTTGPSMDPSTPGPRLRTPWLEVLAAALPAALHALVLLGRLHPDEVFQSLEPALHRAFGFGVLAWEWQVGLRNQAVPILFAWLLKGAAALGLDSVMARRTVLELPQYGLHAAMLGAVWRLSARRVGPRLARWCLWLTALYAPVVWFGGRPMSESFSVALLVWAVDLLDGPGPGVPRWQAPAAGLLLGLSVVARYGSAAVVLPVMGWLLWRRRWTDFALAAAAGLAVALLLGLLDLATWGDWFHSFRAYLDFNLTSGKAAAQFGAQPPWFYLSRLALAPWGALGLVLWRWRPGERAWLPLVAGLGYLVVVSATAHKEERFLYPTLVLLSVAGTPALVATLAARWTAASSRALVAACALGGGAFFALPSPWAPQRQEQFQLEVEASHGATGLVLLNEGVWGSGGFFYLGRNIPWFPCDFPEDPRFQAAMADPRFNRGVAWSNGDPAERDRDARAEQAFLAAGFRLAQRRGQASLFVR